MRASARRLLLVLSLPTLACQGPEPGGAADGSSNDSSTAAPESDPHVTFVGRVDVVELCGVVGATLVSFRARQVGCEQGPPAPCTIPTDPHRAWVGDAALCPSGQTALEMRVEVPVGGRFAVEARTFTDSGGTLGLCYGVGGASPTLATAAQVEARAEIVVRALTGPCGG